MTNYRKLLKEGQKIGVWGTGYIGFSSMVFFARKGIRSIGTDISVEKIETIRRGEYIFEDLKNWLKFSIKHLVDERYIEAHTDYRRLLSEDVIVHLIAVPTERQGEPFFDIIGEVVDKICEMDTDRSVKPLIIIESTLSPRTSDEFILPRFEAHGWRPGKGFLYGVAPRRDWFVDGGKNLTELDRVFGGYDDASRDAIQDVLGVICKNLHSASSYAVAEMVKSFENAYRHMEITLANQISLAYPNDDIREALRLAGTKWNIGTFYPGFGTGGYCIPLASKYVILGSEYPEELGILKATIETDSKINHLIGKSIARRNFKNIGVLGLSYKGNLKVNILSPTIPFVNELKRTGVQVKVNDPYYSEDEIRDIIGTESFSFPEGLVEFEALVLITDHDIYRTEKVKRYVKGCRFILDNPGIWSDFFKTDDTIEYHLSGDRGWL